MEKLEKIESSYHTTKLWPKAEFIDPIIDSFQKREIKRNSFILNFKMETKILLNLSI